jgi:malto-oligosyltrehalose trehalohydrolase
MTDQDRAGAGTSARHHAIETTWGATVLGDGRVRFRLWAPQVDALILRLRGEDVPMDVAGDGWFERVADARPGDAYAFVLPDGLVVPDPASRAQTGDVHGPSRLVDPRSYAWRHDWSGRPWEEAVVYELHVGTFTPEGTFAAAAERLEHLAETGITAVELMPVAQFAGDRGWGYDGVLLYAPHRAYGTPDELKAFVDAAHGRGLMVLLDVVYNHFGPDGNYLHSYAEDFFDAARDTPWGPAIAYARPQVRRFAIENALYWLEEYRFDGLRLDAIDSIYDPSGTDVLVELAQEVRARITDRPVHLTTEDNRNITRLHERGEGGSVPLHTAEWNDDVHNAAHVIATHESEGYYREFTEHRWELFAQALAEGFAYQGQHSPYQDAPRGEPSAHLPPQAFVDFLQNHDQTGNRAFGDRLITLADHRMVEALTSILCLSPHIPLFFMGEEWGETRPFCFFTDFHGELAEAVRDGRRREFMHFAAFSDESDVAHIPDPNAMSTFEASRIDWAHRATPGGQAAMTRLRDLLALRQAEVVPHLADARGNAGRVVHFSEGEIAVDWQLGSRSWQLRANLSDENRALPGASGREVYRSGDGSAADAPAFWVGFSADDAR